VAQAASSLQPARTQALPATLWPLLFGNFVIGTGVMVVPGTLPEISSSLAVSVPAAGQLSSASALLMCVGSPAIAAVVAGWDRRRLLALTMAWYALLHLACTAAPSFSALLPLRVLAMIAPAIFTAQAAASVGLLVPPQQRSRALTVVYLGWSLASVLGLPMGAYIGGTLGWRSAFGVVSILSLASAFWVWRGLPAAVHPPAMSAAAWRRIFRSSALMRCLLVSTLFSGGQGVLFAYLAPYFKQVLGATSGQLGLVLGWFGILGFLSTTAMSRRIERIGPSRAAMLGIASVVTTMLLWPLGAGSILLTALVMVPWALGLFTTTASQQARLVAIAPAMAAASVALNSSAMYAGQALGAAGGGWIIAHAGLEVLHRVSFCALLVAMAASAWASRGRGPAP
jgi:predicted MFS family arabinose efflux permease